MTTDTNWLPAPDAIALQDGEVQIWRVDLAAAQISEPNPNGFWNTLSPDEKERAEKFHFERDRNHFVASHGVLRDILSRFTSRAPSKLEFVYNPQKKPSFATGSEFENIHFNLSHSHGIALCAVTTIGAVGVDLEKIQNSLKLVDTAGKIFGDGEISIFQSLPPEIQEIAFLNCWTRKEAYLKAVGVGLQIDPRSFRVSFIPGEPTALGAGVNPKWTLREFKPAAGYVGAVVVDGPIGSVRLLEWLRVELPG
jgi:4'-phosphopantetheinyl transferase